MDYEQKFLLFKKIIYKTFSSYEKKYSVNFKNKTFVVKFILTDPEYDTKNATKNATKKATKKARKKARKKATKNASSGDPKNVTSSDPKNATSGDPKRLITFEILPDSQ